MAEEGREKMEPIQELVARGKQHFEDKEYDQAERYFRQVLKYNNRYADVHNMLGVICHIEGKFDGALQHFKEAVTINPNYTEALLNLAVLHNDLGEYKEAKKLYTDLQKRNGKGKQKDIEPVLKGKLSNLHADIGDIYRSIGLYAFAIDEYEKALRLNADYSDIRIKLGIALREEGRLKDSIKELKKVLQDASKNVAAHIQLGITNYSLGAMADAKKDWNEALKQDPKNESAKMYLRLCAAMKPASARSA